MLISQTGSPAFDHRGIETPALVVSQSALEANIARLQSIADTAGCSLRPHAKTHKSLRIAALQLAAGATGITVAKTQEALVFMRAGIGSVTVATPVVHAAKLDRLLAAKLDHGTDLRLIADSLEGAYLIAARARAHGTSVGLYLKIDVGLGRVGVLPNDPSAVDIATGMAGAKGLVFLGLLSHAGHAYGAGDARGAARVAEQERQDMLSVAERLRRAHVEVPIISVGSTPTVLSATSLEGIDELRPGNGVFLDLLAVRLGLCSIADVALGVVSTVVSVGSRHAILDAGSKVLSSDLGAHGMSSDGAFGRAYPFGGESEGYAVERLSEEHGFISAAARLHVGDVVLILPNHACPLPNLVGAMTMLLKDGGREEVLAEAASCVR